MRKATKRAAPPFLKRELLMGLSTASCESKDVDEFRVRELLDI